ncbi:hypothetical protein RHGRI_028372 [Rhododendron griersonianum]|uniref:Uncharacterized protein n=1 Tax=Rhododendron griersonianum TaxID=479676 RepID=A0AAV6IHR0_9ERIC|nr:hypothetical protein RHGRI_028372 [Rhododendron griersonianum]
MLHIKEQWCINLLFRSGPILKWQYFSVFSKLAGVLSFTANFNSLRPEPRSRPIILRLSKEFLSRRKALASPIRTISLLQLCNRNVDFVHKSNEQVISPQT